jgi:DNA-binding beta-propeller fold protein YncE
MEGTMKTSSRLLPLCAFAGGLLLMAGAARAQLLITGNDEKVWFDETGKTVNQPPGKDTVSIIDIREPTKPRILASLPLMNTIIGPPVNLAITPDQHLALVANSLDWVKDGEGWKGAPDNKIYVIDLAASPPAQIATVEAGKQPSGMAINRAGTLALVANRADDSVSVLAIDGKTVKPVGTVSVATQPSPAVAAPPPALPAAVAITPDGKRALVVKSGANRVGLLDIDGQKVSNAQVDGKNYDMATGLNPLNVQITPDGKLAIVNNIGGGQDGGEPAARHRSGGRRRRPGRAGDEPGRGLCRLAHTERYRRHAQDRLLSTREILCGVAQDRRKVGPQGGTDRCRRTRRGHLLQPGRALALCCKLCRQRRRCFAARRGHLDEGGELAAAGAPRVDARQHAVTRASGFQRTRRCAGPGTERAVDRS